MLQKLRCQCRVISNERGRSGFAATVRSLFHRIKRSVMPSSSRTYRPRCRRSAPNGSTRAMRTARRRKTGRWLPLPNGASGSNASASARVASCRSRSSALAERLSTARMCGAAFCAAALMPARNAFTSLACKPSPAAIGWPPLCSRKCACVSIRL